MAKLVKGQNDLATVNPELAKQWHPTKNGNLTPSDITSGSSKEVWWICDKGHEWCASPNSRVSHNRNRNCPFCSGRKAWDGFNDLKTWCIENNREFLLKEWNDTKNWPLTPSNVSKGSGKKVSWICDKGHEWQAVISSRTNSHRPGKCPYCANKKVLTGFNDFATWCNSNGKEYLLEEWDYEKNTILPQNVLFGSALRVYWKCKKGHEWEAPICQRHTTNCPKCTMGQTSFPEQVLGYYLSKYFNTEFRKKVDGFEIDLLLTDYNIGIEYDGYLYHLSEKSKQLESAKNEALEKKGITLIRVKETKNRKEIVDNTIFFIQKGSYVTADFKWAINKLFELLSQILKSSTVPDIDVSRDEMEIRSFYQNKIEEESIERLYPELISEWNTEKNKGLMPNMFTVGSNVKVWWKCENGHEWQAVISSRTKRELGCPFCAGQKVDKGNNDFETWCRKNNKTTLLQEWSSENDLKPNEIAYSSNTRIVWECSVCNHKWTTYLGNRIKGTGCPNCSSKASKGNVPSNLKEWCLANNKQLLEEWNYEKNGSLTPDNINRGSHKKVWWKCENGHEWQAVIKSRVYGAGCPICYGKLCIKGLNDLETWCIANNCEQMLNEWNYEKNNGLTPDEVSYGSHKKVWWKCSECGYEWEAVVKDRTQSKSKCPFCRKREH